MARESIVVATTRDTIYQRRMRDLVRRARMVRTDSLAKLYAAIATTPESGLYVLRQKIGCEDLRLIVGHGGAASRRAIARMRDSLLGAGVAFDRDDARVNVAPGPNLTFTKDNCGVTFGSGMLADSLEYEPLPSPRPRGK